MEYGLVRGAVAQKLWMTFAKLGGRLPLLKGSQTGCESLELSSCLRIQSELLNQGFPSLTGFELLKRALVVKFGKEMLCPTCTGFPEGKGWM
jgi:hypothetical protein